MLICYRQPQLIHKTIQEIVPSFIRMKNENGSRISSGINLMIYNIMGISLKETSKHVMVKPDLNFFGVITINIYN